MYWAFAIDELVEFDKYVVEDLQIIWEQSIEYTLNECGRSGIREFLHTKKTLHTYVVHILAIDCKWTGWVWEFLGWSWRPII
jgi:hypothetical protein